MQPDKILHYKIESHLGSGAFGDVYLAYDEKLNRHVAIKIAAPNKDEALQKELSARFELEVGATVKLNHPNIVTVYDAGATEAGLYYVMAHLTGGDLKLNNSKIVTNLAVVQVCIDVTKALAYAHDVGFIHRDIKPENILFDTHGNAVVADFGIVKAMGQDYTMGRYVMGTPSYSAPEQLDANEEIDGRADLYSLGKVLYFMLTKRKYVADDVDVLPTDKEIFNPILTRLLSKDRDGRFKTAHDLLKALDALQLDIKKNTEEATVLSQHNIEPRRRPAYLIPSLVAACLLVVVFVGGFIFFQQPDGEDTAVVQSDLQPKPVVEDIKTNQNDGVWNEGDAIVSINSVPSGADVYLKGRLVGKTPFSSESMPVGSQVFELKKRYFSSQSLIMALESKKVAKQVVHLERGVGGLSIISEPVGAQVWVDGKAVVGKTPLSISGVSAGKQNVDIRKGDVSVRQVIEVDHGQVAILRVSLVNGHGVVDVQPLASNDTTDFSINSNPPGAVVYIDGKRVGVTPLEKAKVDVGIRSIRLSAQFYEDLEFDLDFSAGQAVVHFEKLKLGKGSISVISTPAGASVQLDGKPIAGFTPLSLNNVGTGKHTIDIRKDDLRLKQDIEVEAGAATLIEGALESGQLVPVESKWLSLEELMAAASQSDDLLVRLKFYRLVLDADSTHIQALEGMENIRQSVETKINDAKEKHDYKKARELSDMLVEKLEPYITLPDYADDINTHEKAFVRDDKQSKFETKYRLARSLMESFHFSEAEKVIIGLGNEYDGLDAYDELQSLFKRNKSVFMSKVLSVTGPLVLVKREGSEYLRASAHEVTFRQWDECVADSYCQRSPNDFGWGRGDRPVVDVSFEDIQTQFLPWLVYKTGINFRLPNEADWDALYGDRIVVTAKHANGPSGFGWQDDGAKNTAVVGEYLKNANGVYDLNGNVWEWIDECNDKKCSRRIVKGGSWNSAPKFFSNNERWLEFPTKRSNDIGFRVVADYEWKL